MSKKKSIFDEIAVLNKYLHMSTDNFVKYVYNEVGSPKVYVLSMNLNYRYNVRVNGEEVPNFIVDVPFLRAIIDYQKQVSTMDSPVDLGGKMPTNWKLIKSEVKGYYKYIGD